MNNFNNIQDFMTRFNQFKQNYNNQLTPQQMVQQLLDSGQMTQQQFNQLSAMANQIMNMKR